MASTRTVVGAILMLLGGGLALSAQPSGDLPEVLGKGPESRGRLIVESVVHKPGSDGGVIEVRFRLAGVDRLPGDPTETYVMDEESGEKMRVRQIPMLPPTSSAAPGPSRPAAFVVPNYRNRIAAGKVVTVVVAGLRQEHVIVQPAGGVENTAPAPPGNGAGVAPPEAPPQGEAAKPVLKVLMVRPTAEGELLDVRYKMTGLERIPADSKDTYLVDQATGARLLPLGVTRIGLLSTKHVQKAGTAFLIVKNPGRKVKPGDKVTVVIAGVQEQNVVVKGGTARE